MEPEKRIKARAHTTNEALASAHRMDIEVYTARYEREHGHRPQGRRFWRFTLVSSITTKDHFLDLSEQMTYPDALARALEVARLRKSERIIVEP